MADGYGHLPRGPKRLMMAARWSAQGLRAAWLHESESFRLEVVLALVLAPLGLLLGETGVERALLATTVLLVLPVELLNSAIEAVIERYGPEHHELLPRSCQRHGLGCGFHDVGGYRPDMAGHLGQLMSSGWRLIWRTSF